MRVYHEPRAILPINGEGAGHLLRFSVDFLAPSPGVWTLTWSVLTDDMARFNRNAAFSEVLGLWLIASVTNQTTGERLDVRPTMA